MLNSNERMGFIIEYMSSYDEKIKMANKNGLFDAAKMFELFAIEVCNVWFGQKFSNLNDETATYPYVDLISENRELLVQVSTVQDVPTKIKTTLEKIRDSKDKKCSDLKNIVFFVLSMAHIAKRDGTFYFVDDEYNPFVRHAPVKTTEAVFRFFTNGYRREHGTEPKVTGNRKLSESDILSGMGAVSVKIDS